MKIEETMPFALKKEPEEDKESTRALLTAIRKTCLKCDGFIGRSHYKDCVVDGLTCDTCGEGMKNFRALQLHGLICILRATLSCRRCRQSFPSKKLLRYHRRHTKCGDVAKRFGCPDCGFLAKTEWTLTKHRAALYACTFHKARLSLTRFRTRDGYLQCPRCRLTTLRVAVLVKHMRGLSTCHAHAKRVELQRCWTEGGFACSKCAKLYPTSAQLATHWNNSFCNTERYLCDDCTFIGPSRDPLLIDPHEFGLSD